MNNHWNPDLYLRFQKERTQPSIDLVNRLEMEAPKKILDAGCGPGNSTEILFKRWPNAELTGLDVSEEMIKKARESYPDQHWVHSGIMEYNKPAYFDLVFSNAVLQWLPDQDNLVTHMVSLIKPGGILAVQVPQNQNSPLHRALGQVAAQAEFKDYTREAREALHYRSGSYYYNALTPLLEDLSFWETTYYHVMENHEDLIQWYRSTGMRPYLQALPNEEMRENMLNQVLSQCCQAYQPEQDNRIIFPFNRLFFMGKKPNT